MKILFWILFWFFYFPLIRLLTLFLFWNSKVEERERFEKRNKFEYLAHSFKEVGVKADLCFEFSSEGEFQQVAPLIEDALTAGKKIELVFFSPSVEKAIMRIAQAHPAQVRYLRYPFVRIFPFIRRRSFTHWVTAKTLIMVRYDLFPEFLLWSMQEGHELKLVWMSFKKDRSKGKGISFWKKLFLKNSTGVVYAGPLDEKEGKDIGVGGKVFDFRMEQIHRRMLKKEEKFQNTFSLYPKFKVHLRKFERAIILGNAWPSDLFLLKDLPKDVLLVIVPHQLSHQILNKFSEDLEKMGREVFEIGDPTRVFQDSTTLLLNKKGILCELYSDFTHAYVGGGFEGSIHSVLEPLVAGTPFIACGPAHHRSTEYDMAVAAGKIAEINSPEQFMSWLNKNDKNSDHAKMEVLLKDYVAAREYVISC